MPRRQKPPGYEKWTWAEINAGRRMSKTEKRWNRMAKSLDWDQRPDGTYQAPPNAVPYLVAIAVLIVVLAVLAPNGMQSVKGDNAAAALLVFLMIAVSMILLVVFGRNEPAVRSYSHDTDPVPLTGSTPADPAPRQPTRPVLRPAFVSLCRRIGAALSFRWVTRLPDWLQPIVWGLAITAPAVAITLRWRLKAGWLGNIALCLCLVASGCALRGLVHDGLRARRERREQEEHERAEMRERFRKVLAHELCSRKQREFDFTALVAEHAIPRFEADAAAAQVYRRFSDRVVEDGVITAEEQRRLESLARLLEIGPDRVAVIEAAAKSVRFQAAVEQVLADGVVTEEEVRELKQIRASLGVSDEDWQKGREQIGASRLDDLIDQGMSRHA